MKRSVAAAMLVVLACAAHPALTAEPNFATADVIAGVQADRARYEGPGKVWVETGGAGNCLRFYGSAPARGSVAARAIVYLDGDAVLSGNCFDNNVVIWSGYPLLSRSGRASRLRSMATAGPT